MTTFDTLFLELIRDLRRLGVLIDAPRRPMETLDVLETTMRARRTV